MIYTYTNRIGTVTSFYHYYYSLIDTSVRMTTLDLKNYFAYLHHISHIGKVLRGKCLIIILIKTESSQCHYSDVHALCVQ